MRVARVLPDRDSPRHAAWLRAGLVAAPGIARSRRGRLVLATGTGLAAVCLALLAARSFAATSWPLVHGHPGLLAAAGLLFLLASMLKVYAWRALFATNERPRTFALAAATGGASVVSLALPSRFGDAARVAIVRRSHGCPAGVPALCLSLVMLGLVDTAALAPLAFTSAALPGHAVGIRVSVALVAGVGIAAAALVVALPRLAATRKLLNFRLGRWLRPRTVSLRDASGACALACAHWLARAVGLVLLLGTLGVGFSLPLAMLFLCAGAIVGALPLAPAGAAMQAGAGAGVLVASGVGTSQAIDVAIAGQVLGALGGVAILVLTVLPRLGRRLTGVVASVPRRHMTTGLVMKTGASIQLREERGFRWPRREAVVPIQCLDPIPLTPRGVRHVGYH